VLFRGSFLHFFQNWQVFWLPLSFKQPSHFILHEKVACNALKKFLLKTAGGVTAAGPHWLFTNFPIKPEGAGLSYFVN